YTDPATREIDTLSLHDALPISLGADVVGMSTVPEVITAVHLGVRVLGVSIITDQCLPDALRPTSMEQIIAVARGAEPKLAALVRDRKSTRLNSSHLGISYAVFC